VAGNVVNSTSFSPFGSFKGEIKVANADFNGDGVNDFVVAQGKNGKASVRVLNGTDPTGGTLLFKVAAYSSTFHGGVNVAAADVDGDGVPELITAPDSGLRPVKVFSGVGAHTLLFTLSPFGTTFKAGVRVAAGDINGDGRADLIMGAGPCVIGPRVLIVSGADTTVVLGDFKAFQANFRGGVYVAAGDVNGDGRADVIVGAGTSPGASPGIVTGVASTPSPGAQVNVYDGGNFKGGFSSVITTFQAYAGFNGGVRVAAADFNADGRADIITGPGPGKGFGPRLKAFIAATTSEVESFFVFDDPNYEGGLNL